MRLSEAIRLGATIRPQAFGDYFGRDGSCAIGAAAEASGEAKYGESRPIGAFELANREVIGRMHRSECPEGCGNLSKISVSPIVHLNDEHRWTRERIADFVELHEPLPAPSDMVVSDENAVEGHATAAAL